MATRIEEILGRDINSLKELREEIKRLQDSIANVDPTTQEFVDTSQKLIAAQEQLTSVTRASKDANVAAADSIVGMEKEYKNLYNTYKMLTEEQRNSDFGKNMAESLNTLSTKLNETKKNVGNFKDNIGRYSESVIDAFSKMGGSVGGLIGPFASATKGVVGFNAALKANPVGAVIGLITTLISVIKALAQGIKGNEESQMRLNQAMASFQPIIDAAKNAMDRMGQAIVKVIEFIAKVVDKIRIAKAAFTDFIGITKGAKEAVKEQQKTYKDLAASVNNLTKTKREYQKLNAADEAEVQRLREEASEATTLEEKRRLLNEAKDKQAEIDNRNIEIAKEELRILTEQSNLTANDAAANDALAAAVAKVSQAEATAANNMRAFNKQLGTNMTSTNGASTATKNYREEAKKLYEDTLEWNKTELQKLTEKYEKEKKLLEKYHLDTNLLTKKYEKERQDIIYEGYKTTRDRIALEYQLKQEGVERERRLMTDSETISSQIMENLVNASKLKGVLKDAEDAFTQWADESYLGTFFMGESSQGWQEFEKGSKRWWEEVDKSFKEIFKPGTDWSVNTDPYLRQAREAFEEASLITGDNIIDIDSIKLNIKILENEVKKLQDSRILKSLDFKLNENLLSYFEGLNNVLTTSAKNAGEEIEKLGYTELENRVNILKETLESETFLEEASMETKLQVQQQYYEALADMRERSIALAELEADRTQNAWNDSISALGSIGSSLGNISQSYETVINAKLKDGKITKEQADKQKKSLADLEEVIKWVNIASVVSQTAAGIMGVWKAYALEKVANAETAAAAGPAAAGVLTALNTKSLISAIAQTAGLAATGIAQVASIRANAISRKSALTDPGSGGAAGTAATPAEIDSTPYTYTRQVQTADEEDAIYNKEYFVSVTDIDNMQNRVRVRDGESSF